MSQHIKNLEDNNFKNKILYENIQVILKSMKKENELLILENNSILNILHLNHKKEKS